MNLKKATSTENGKNVIISTNEPRTFNPLAAGSIPARPTKNINGFRWLSGSPFLWRKWKTSTNIYASALILLILALAATPAAAHADGWDFYFFGVNTKTFKEADWKMVVLGAATSLAVHTAGHVIYGELSGMDYHMDGFREVVEYDNPARHNRHFSQAGFITQHLVGLVLTTIPATRQTDFTKGYVVEAWVQTASHPLIWTGKNDLSTSDRYGGDRDLEFIGYMAVATHNILRVKWEKE